MNIFEKAIGVFLIVPKLYLWCDIWVRIFSDTTEGENKIKVLSIIRALAPSVTWHCTSLMIDWWFMDVNFMLTSPYIHGQPASRSQLWPIGGSLKCVGGASTKRGCPSIGTRQGASLGLFRQLEKGMKSIKNSFHSPGKFVSCLLQRAVYKPIKTDSSN